ncbi:hypothetical protein [Adhaeribacter radiodurans]|uniref:Uncharacterized protein n=1 Tax=Adhaeribacter radiodurans TaxID=2745197 RepID=A0A7L7LD08_9BACT|nr:hypothetical protein [Adhaeribacter radiodurans]QMU30574.1 hypothetical protein HUW48_22235 [Adhaeribacter radiodurans]
MGNFDLFISIIKFKLIPAKELDDVQLSLFYRWYKLYKVNNSFLPLGERLQEFKTYIKPIWLIRVIHITSDLDRANKISNREFIKDFIYVMGLDKEIVSHLSDVFSQSYPPYGLYDTLHKFFKNPDNISYKEQLIKLTTVNNLKIPKKWIEI